MSLEAASTQSTGMNTLLVFLVMTMVALGISACGGDSSGGEDAAYQARLDESTCPFTLHASQIPGTTVRCGLLVVPQDRRIAGGEMISLPFAVFRSATAKGAAPVVYLTGGPGDIWGDSLPSVQADQSPGFLSGSKLTRDEIVIEQRGASLSSPALSCTSTSWGPEFFRDSTAALANSLNGVRSCRDGLIAAGIDPAAYQTNELAADVNDLRRLLGYDKIVLDGVSYGTRWALAVLREYPDSVESVILDSTTAQSIPGFTSAAQGLEAGVIAVASACAAQTSCDNRYPNLGARTNALLAALNTQPLAWELGPNGEFTSAVMFGVFVAEAMFSPGDLPATVALFETLVADNVPVDSLPADRQAALISLARLGFDTSASPTSGQYWSITCADNALVTQADIDSAISQVGAVVRPLAQAGLNAIYSTCQNWPYRTDLPKRTYEPVNSDVRILLLSGGLDPATPPAWATETAATLSSSLLVHFPARGHALQGSGACVRSIVTAFIDGQAVDTSCSQTETIVFQ